MGYLQLAVQAVDQWLNVAQEALVIHEAGQQRHQRPAIASMLALTRHPVVDFQPHFADRCKPGMHDGRLDGACL